jgi:3',5'-cyclic AMP phosphodiesterase CpdA
MHLSDLHFGKVQPGLPEALLREAREGRPDVVVVSGDLTQRARPEEFREARRFLDQFSVPLIAVPGNHDVPLYNLYGRFVKRLERFRMYISDDLDPSYSDSEIAIFGVNTARSLTWKNGRINPAQIQQIRSRLCGLPREVIRVVVTHHPFDLPAGFGAGDLLGSARHAFEQFASCGADLLLCGHLHVANAMTTLERYGSHWRALVVSAGTAISTRGRGAPNSFNMIRLDRGTAVVSQRTWDETTRGYPERSSPPRCTRSAWSEPA